jgi:hypothetical protein
MPGAVPVPIRRMIWQRARRGESTRVLEEAYQVAPRTVRSLCRRFRSNGGALEPNYHAPATPACAKPPDQREAICGLRRTPFMGSGVDPRRPS